MPVLEAMAAGTPVLTSFVSSLPEVAGGAAMLVDPMNVDAIASGLLRALTQDLWRAEAVERGLARARGLTWARNADRTARLYRELYGSKARERDGGTPAVHPPLVWRSHSSR
jgi:alpha-1,3-rhamnosyl/mannosyltransferase